MFLMMNSHKFVFRLIQRSRWYKVHRKGMLWGELNEQAERKIHLSPVHLVWSTFNRKFDRFKEHPDEMVALKFEVSKLGPHVRWTDRGFCHVLFPEGALVVLDLKPALAGVCELKELEFLK